MSKKRFMITGIEKGCYRIGNVKDIRKDTGLLGSVRLSELTGESCILDMLNQLNNENEQLRQQIERLNLAIDDLASHTSCDDLRKENEQLRKELNDCEKFRYQVFKRMGGLYNE